MPAWYQGPDPFGLGADPDDDSPSGSDAVTRAATAYTRNVPESVQVSIGLPVTAVARSIDYNPGATVRPADAGPTDAFGDRRGPIDDVLDMAIERDSSDAVRGEFEDDSDLPGPSVGEFGRNPSEGTAKLIGQAVRFSAGNFDVHGQDGEQPDNPDGKNIGRLALVAVAALAAIVAIGQLFTFEVGS